MVDNVGKHHWTIESKVLCVGGSPRKGGNTDVILKTFASVLKKKGVANEIVHLRDYSFLPCIGCEQCRKDHICRGHQDGMQLLYPKIESSQGMFLVSPTHHYNITAWMKAFIDRMYCFYEFGGDAPRSWSSRLAGQGRKAAIAAICEQAEKKDMGITLEAMRWPMEAFGYEIVEELAVYKVFRRAAVKENEQVFAEITAIAEKMARLLMER